MMKERCVRGHFLDATRVTYESGYSACGECRKLARIQWAIDNPEREAEIRQLSRNRTRPQARIRNMRAKHGLTEMEFSTMLVAQDGGCAICGTSHFGIRANKPAHAFVDHDHSTGVIRGLLCDKCNLGLGAFGDSPELLLEAAGYLKNGQ